MSPQNELTILNKAPASMHILVRDSWHFNNFYRQQQKLQSTTREHYCE